MSRDTRVPQRTLRDWCRRAGVSVESAKRRLSPEDFVRAWQQAESPLEVALATGLTVQQACARATAYRRRGVPLQRFSRSPNWDALAEIAREANNGTTMDK